MQFFIGNFRKVKKRLRCKLRYDIREQESNCITKHANNLLFHIFSFIRTEIRTNISIQNSEIKFFRIFYFSVNFAQNVPIYFEYKYQKNLEMHKNYIFIPIRSINIDQMNFYQSQSTFTAISCGILLLENVQNQRHLTISNKKVFKINFFFFFA